MSQDTDLYQRHNTTMCLFDMGTYSDVNTRIVPEYYPAGVLRRRLLHRNGKFVPLRSILQVCQGICIFLYVSVHTKSILLKPHDGSNL